MKKVFLAGVAALTIVGSTAVYAQHRPWFHHHGARMNPEDRAAFADARIAAVRAGLRLTPDQDKLWPPLESAVRDFARLRIDRANARMQSLEGNDRSGPRDEFRDSRRDPVARLRERADRMGETAAALKRIAETADPLYKTLDGGQKRRLAVLTGMGGRFRGGWRDRDMGRGSDRDLDRGSDRDSDREFDRGGPDRAPGRGSGRDRELQRDRSSGPDRL